MYSKTNPFTKVIANGTATKNNEDVSTNQNEGSSEIGSVIAAAESAPTSGFGAYTNINPFAAIAAKMPSFASATSTCPAASFSFGSGEQSLSSSKQDSSSTPPLSINLVPENTPSLLRPSSESAIPSFGVSGTALPNGLGRPSSFSSVPSDGSLFSSYTTKAPFAVVIPSPQTSSPKAQNPFSNPSPKHNPFVTIVESKDNIWSAASRSSSGNRTGSSENDSLNESKSFPFPSLSVPGSSSASTSAPERSTSTDALECKSVFGSQNKDRRSSKEKDGDDEDAVVGDDEHGEEQVYGKVYPMPDNVTVVTGEENEECVIQVRAKLFRLSVPTDTDSAVKPAESLEHSHSIPSSGSGIFTQLISDRVIDGSVTATTATTATATTAAAGAGIADVLAIQNTSKTETDLKIEEENPKVPEKKNKSIGEWIEVGIGPVRILKQRESSDFNRGDERRKTINNNSEIITSKKRMVMRREDKKGGKGKPLTYFYVYYH